MFRLFCLGVPKNMAEKLIAPRVVLIAVETLGGGGAERVALDLVEHWPPGHARPVLLVGSLRGEYVDTVPVGVHVIEVGVPSSPRRTLRFLRQLKANLAGYNVVGVVSHMTGMNRMMLRAQLAGIVRAPVVAVEHNNFLFNSGISQMAWLRALLLRSETGFLYRRAHAIVGCSEGVSTQIGEIFGIDPVRLRTIVNPVDRRFLRKATISAEVSAWLKGLARPILVSVGRMVAQKGFDDLIRAFAMLPEGTLVILGEGPLRAELFGLAQSLGVADRVVMPGFLSAPEQVLQAADLYVSASHWDGYPLTLIEAYASGLPVVAGDCDFGPSEIVRPERPGRLVRSGDIAALADAIVDCLKHVRRFTPGTVVDLTENDPDHVAGRYRDLLLEER
jgi:glycosyltransferase involved in cell wall biosynthesis